MTLLKHPYSDLYYDDKLIQRYAALEDDGMSVEEAIARLEARGFVRVCPEGTPTLVPGITALLSVGEDLAEGIRRIAENNSRTAMFRVDSPYYTKEEAAAYLKTTVDGIYGRVERGQLERCPGPQEYLFTKEMLDDYVMGRWKKPVSRRKRR